MRLRRKKRPRTGAALIEFALCLPLFLAIAVGTLETCRMIYLRQSLKIAAYEAARLAIVPGIDAQSVQDQCDVFLWGRNISGHEFSCTPQDPAGADYEDIITITVSMPAEEYALFGAWFYQGQVITQSVSIMAEY